jgi:hypothetical protein
MQSHPSGSTPTSVPSAVPGSPATRGSHAAGAEVADGSVTRTAVSGDSE